MEVAMISEEKITQTLEELKQKLQVLEDKEEIRDLISQYSYNADLGRNDAYIQLFSEDGEFNLYSIEFDALSVVKKQKAVEKFKGHARLKELLEAAGHQSFTNMSQHILNLALKIDIDGDKATATGYDIGTVRWQAGFNIWRCAMRKWDFRRIDGRWLIENTESIPIGDPECQRLIPADSQIR